MNIKDYVKTFNLPYDKVRYDFKEDFDSLFSSEKEWLENLEDKIRLLKNEKNETAILTVIKKLKNSESFTENDTSNLSVFISKVNTIVQIANRINNFKEGTLLDNSESLHLHDLFNAVQKSKNLNTFSYNLNTNLINFLPHLYSVIKHCQNPNEYPVYYKYWKNILREVLSKEDDYDSMCSFYRTFPVSDRHLIFATYLGTIGMQIAKNIEKSGISLSKDTRDYKYLKNDVINIDRYNSILDTQISKDSNTVATNKQYWLYAPGENASRWNDFYNKGIMGLGWDKIGNLNQYQSRDEIKQALVKAYGGKGSKKNDVSANNDFLNKMKIGDIIIAKKGRGELLGFGVVTSGYTYDKDRSEYQNIRDVSWKLKGNWKVDFSLAMKTLTNITKYSSDHPDYETYFERLLGIMGQNNETKKIEDLNFPLNTILYGPPGTGKTYNTIIRAAQIIENRLIGSYDEALKIFKANLHNKIEFITFHQNYSYEDFIQGLRPDTKDETEQLRFKKSDGVFKKISDRALKNLKESGRAPEELSKEKNFEKALGLFIDDLHDNDGVFKITENCQVYEVEEDAFRYTGDNWTQHANGIRMKFSDLTEFYSNDITSRKEIKSLENISGLAKQHATYYFGVYNEIKKYLSKTKVHIENIVKQNYVIIIDEINRANISRVFGELITLIESDKRSHGSIPLEARLPSGDSFIVPSNLFIIGTMNTADKSIALLDIALRRRFEFEPMYPKYSEDGIKVNDENVLKSINKSIIVDKGHDFQIGHSYFMDSKEDPYNFKRRMNVKVIPLLLEYFMNDSKTVSQIISKALNETTFKIDGSSWPLKISERND